MLKSAPTIVAGTGLTSVVKIAILLVISSLVACNAAAARNISSAAENHFPQKPVTIVVPFSTGGSPDQLARLLGQKLGELWKIPVVVDNRPGAGGNIAATAVARAAPDGYTLLMGTDGPLAINTAIYAELPYDPIRDFYPIGTVATVDFVLVAAPSVKATNLDEFIALAARQNPPMAYGSSGIGSQHHLGMETFRKRASIELLHVPYRGVAPALADVMGNQVPVMFAAVPSAAPLIHAKKVRALAVTGRQRSKMLPDVPTMNEAGIKDFELKAWFGLVAPAQTPPDVINKINSALHLVLSMPDVRTSMDANGFEIKTGSPQEFSRLIASEQERWAAAAKLAGVTAQ